MNIFIYVYIHIHMDTCMYPCVYFIMVTKKRRGHGLERK